MKALKKTNKSSNAKKRVRTHTKEKDRISFLEVLAQTYNISNACKMSGICRHTFYEWKKKFPDFKKQAEDINESLIDLVESSLLNKIQEGDTTAIIFFLKCRAKDRGYIEKGMTFNIDNRQLKLEFIDGNE